MTKARRVGLQTKLVFALLLVALVPLAVTAVLVGNIGRVAQNFAANHVAELRPHLMEAQSAYRRLVEAKKREYQSLARRIAMRGDVHAKATDAESAYPDLAPLSTEAPDLLRVELLGPQGVMDRWQVRSDLAKTSPDNGRELRVRAPIPDTELTIVAVFAPDESLMEELQSLAQALRVSRRVDTLESSLPRSYTIAFLVLVGGVVIVVTAVALVLARRMARRIDKLVVGTRQVASGNMDVAVSLTGSDELAELASAFNKMILDIQREREKILYLQRIGAWQDVARKLAHEIKNPMTPIQLVVQQVVSSYRGNDPQYQTLLTTCEEIVREEIQGLRRLVDAFRDLGRLPRVEATALPLATLTEDLVANPELAPHLELVGQADGVSVRGDRLLLRRCLVNLLENGIHAGKEAGKGGKVRLQWQPEEGFVRFFVDDEGPGISPQRRERIFDPYETTKETGTGLGLAIAKKVALDHGGDLELRDEPSPLGGARFILTIPIFPPEVS